MAETYTMQPNNEVTNLENLSPEEQDSLAVGEQMQEAQDNLLAGKYQNAQELEQGYLELQKKLGQDDSEEEEEYEEDEEYEEGEYEDEDDDEEYEEDDEYGSILDELWEANQEDEEISDELIDRVNSMDQEELALEYLTYRESVEEGLDFTEDEISDLKDAAGGAAQYDTMVQWAQANLTENETAMFDAVMEKGDPLAAFFAVRALAFTYENAVGIDGDLVQGKAPRRSTSQYRSQAEVVAAISDPRYETDPAYRADVTAKLERSNIDF